MSEEGEERPGDPVVELEGVTKRFGPPGTPSAVDGLDLRIPAGGCFGLLGPNGAGKTTSLRMIYGVTRPTAGRLRVFGIDVARHPRAVRRRLGVTLQDNVLVEDIDCVQNLRIFGRYHGLREPELTQRALELCEFLALDSHAHLPVRALSGGYQRRLAIALSLVGRPELLILDEPTTGLDPAVRHALWGRIRELRAGGTTVLLTTHYMDEAERLCDRIAIMSEGRAVSEASPRGLIERHLAAEAVELDCRPEEEEGLLAGFAGPIRRLRADRRLMLFADDVGPLAEHLRARVGHERGLIATRATNLEDVFLATTGAALEAAA